MFLTLGALKSFAYFTGKIHVLESLFKKASDPQACKLLKKKLHHRYFLDKFARFSRALFLQNTSVALFSKSATAITCLKIFRGCLLHTTNLLSPAALIVTN